MSKNILIAGGAGFLGSNLSARLINDGHRVHCIDDLSTGALSNIDSLLSDDAFTFTKLDISVPFSLDYVYDEIYNLACPASPLNYQEDPLQTMKTSVLGSMNLLGHAHRMDAKILQASTSEIYGNPEMHPQKESYHGNVNPIGIRACYDEGKRCAETLFFDYHRQFGLKIKVMRIFNTYGPYLSFDDGRVVSNFIYQALSGRDITIYGDGSQTRSFCYVDDLIDGMIKLMESPEEIIGPVNIGNPGEFTVKQLAEKVLALVGSRSKLIYVDLPQDDPVKRQPDISLAKTVLNWEPKIPLDDGLVKTISFFKGIL
jgi:UDP-glucuronate decarboxylase